MSEFRFISLQLTGKAFTFFLLLLFNSAIAQISDRGSAAQRGDSSHQQMPAIGKVSGTVLDSSSAKPAEFASVALIRVWDSAPVAGTLADEHGNFVMQEVPYGKFFLKISSIG